MEHKNDTLTLISTRSTRLFTGVTAYKDELATIDRSSCVTLSGDSVGNSTLYQHPFSAKTAEFIATKLLIRHLLKLSIKHLLENQRFY